MLKKFKVYIILAFLAFQQVAWADNFTAKDAGGTTRYFKGNGTGTNPDPYIPVRTIEGISGTVSLPTGAAQDSTLTGGGQKTRVTDGTNEVSVSTSGADAASNTSNRLAVAAWLWGFNGTSWDRIRTGATGATSTLTGFLNALPFGRYNLTPPTLTDGQVVALQLNSAGSLKVDGSGITQPVSGTVTANQGGSWSVSLTGSIPAGTNNIGDVDVLTLPSIPAGANTIGAVTQASGPWSFNQTQVNGVSLATGNGVAGTGVQRVTIASDNSAFTVNAAQSGTWNIGNISGTVSLPTGAATAAKQPALGTAGTASADVLTVQGIASMTPLRVDNGGTFAVQAAQSGTWTMQPGNTANTTPWLSSIHDGTNKASVRDTGSSDSLNVAIVDGSGNQITSFGGGTQYAEGATAATITGTAVLWEDTSDTLRPVSAAKPLPVNIISGAGSGGTAIQDDTAFTVGTTNLTPAGGTYKSVRDAVDDNDAGAFAMTAKRGLYTVLETPNADSAMDESNDAVRVNVVAGSTSGTEYTEDAAAAADPAGPMNMAVRADSLAAVSSTDGDNIALRATNKGELYVKQTDAVPVTDNGGSLTVDGTVSISGTVAATQSGTWNINNVSGTVSLPTGAATSANQSTEITSLQLIDDVIATTASAIPTKGAAVSGTDGTNARVLKTDTSGELQVDVLTIPNVTIGAAIPAGSNNIGDVDVLTLPSIPAGTNNIGDVDVLTLPAIPAGNNNIGDVDVASLPALPSGTNTIGRVNVSPATSGGLSVARDIDLDEASPANIKASAGQVFGWYLFNGAASTRYVKLYNKASAPVLASDTPVLTIPVPAGGAANVEFSNGIEFATGIGWAATTGVGDADTGAPGANEVVANLLYK